MLQRYFMFPGEYAMIKAAAERGYWTTYDYDGALMH
jgi:delta-aminolevulinic acid dehydratase/porphobilinogen synthase